MDSRPAGGPAGSSVNAVALSADRVADLHRRSYFFHGGPGGLARALRALLQDVPDVVGMRGEAGPALVDLLQPVQEVLDEPALAVEAADARGAAAFGGPGLALGRREGPVQIE